MDCGRCGGGLEVTVERGVEIDRCRGCGIVFFDAGELDRYAEGQVEGALHRVRDEGADTAERCPRCDGPMRTIRTASGGIDACTLCAGLRVTWPEGRPPLLDLRPVRRAGRHAAGAAADATAEAAVELAAHGGAALLEVGDAADGLGGLVEGGAELVGGLLGAIGEILGGLG